MKNKHLHPKRALCSALIALLLSLAGLTKATAQTFTVGNLNYSINDDGISVSVTGHVNGTSASGAVAIPASVSYNNTTYPVTVVGNDAFNSCWYITSVTIPNSVTTIGYAAFGSCSSLESVDFGDAVSEIGSSTFSGCYSLTSVVLPDALTTIESHLFNNCFNLVSVTFGNAVTSIGSGAFSGCHSLLSIDLPDALTTIESYTFAYCESLTSIVIPNSVTTIGYAAFGGCSSLESVDFGEAVSNIESVAFNGTGLISVVLPNAVTTIKSDVFSYCTYLESVTLGNAVTSIGEHAFRGCEYLSFIDIPNTVRTIESHAFDGCGLSSITIPSSVKTIGSYAFYECQYLLSVVIDNARTTIGEQAFGDCTYLASVDLGNAVTSIQNHAFINCTNLTSVTIPNSVRTIGTRIFYSCPNLEQIVVASGNPVYDSRGNCNAIIETLSNKLVEGCKSTIIPNTVTVIGESSFSSCSTLTSITIPNSVTSIGDGAFEGCSALTSITIPSQVTSIGYLAFGYCSNLSTLNYYAINCEAGNSFGFDNNLTTLSIGDGVQVIPDYFGAATWMTGTLNLPNSVTRIGTSAFSGAGFTSINIPESVTSIGENAFRECHNLTSIDIPNSVTSIGSYAFYNCYNLTSVKLSNSLTSIESSVFYWCSRLTSIDIPSSITTIGYYAFYSCGLETITIPSSVTSIENGAFYYCDNLTTMVVQATTPPEAEDAFYGTPSDMLVSVPCGSLAAYQNAPVWSDLTNYQEQLMVDLTVTSSNETMGTVAITQSPTCANNQAKVTATPNTGYTFLNWTENGSVVSANNPYTFMLTSDRNLVANFEEEIITFTISATANPAAGGSVNGAGTYEEDATCTLTVVANEGYTFLNWTENGSVLTDAATYTFTVTGNRTLVANFEQITNHWIPEDSNYSDNMTLTGVILIDGVEQRTETIEVGAFCGTECRGSQRATYFAPNDSYIIQMTVFGENNDVISFRLYDHQLGQELLLTPPASIAFNSNGYGSLLNPYELNFISSITHTQTLNSGWNWWSSYIELSSIDGLGQLENSIGSAGIIIKSRNNGYVEAYDYNGGTNWYGNLSSINNEQMYKVRTNAACEATIVGNATLPSSHPINIKNGWNWIGFPYDQNVSVDVALSSFSPENNDIIKGRNGYTTYYSDGNYNMWYGTLNTFEPGIGYMYRSNSSTQKTLVFQTGRGEATKGNVTPESNHFRSDDGNFADNMTLTAVVNLGGTELRSEDFELAAFVGDECRGSVKLMYVEPFDRYIAFLTIFGEQEEDLHFQLTNGVTSSLSTDLLVYTADGIVGSLDNPYVIHFGTMAVDENASANVKVYPNPSEGIFNIEEQNIRKVEVFNAFGQPVYSKEAENEFMKLDLTSCASGIYLIRIVTDNGVLNHQIIKR